MHTHILFEGTHLNDNKLKNLTNLTTLPDHKGFCLSYLTSVFLGAQDQQWKTAIKCINSWLYFFFRPEQFKYTIILYSLAFPNN